MRWFNIGNKDEYGKQHRIEHRGKYLRANRTGGVSLRAQTRKAGLNLTANTQHGFRVSRTVGKNTQVALQNGRFVFRGRYGKGPSRLNVSKSGVTVSIRRVHASPPPSPYPAESVSLRSAGEPSLLPAPTSR